MPAFVECKTRLRRDVGEDDFGTIQIGREFKLGLLELIPLLLCCSCTKLSLVWAQVFFDLWITLDGNAVIGIDQEIARRNELIPSNVPTVYKRLDDLRRFFVALYESISRRLVNDESLRQS